MAREDNIMVFQDTSRLCMENTILKTAIQKSIGSQQLILEDEKLPVINTKKQETKAQIIVSKKRSYEAASAYKDKKVCVHNFASATNPGGGVRTGSGAQEECLCRCSSLYFCINISEMWDGF